MKFLEFYKRYFPDLKETVRKQNVICPFHADSDPSCSLDLEEGLYYCHSCNIGGDIFDFYMKYHRCSFTKAKNDILGNQKAPVLTPTEAKVAHEKLLSSPDLQKLLLVKRGWTIQTIIDFKLGWSDERVYIPIHNKDGRLLNIRKYDVLHKTKQKFLGIEGHNQVRLWPEDILRQEIVIIFGGEPDTILATQMGLPAVTFANGEGTFRAELLPSFENKKVYICYDVDDAGAKGAKVLSEAISKFAAETYVINLPHKILPVKGDFTDLVLYCIDQSVDFTATWNKCVENAIRIDYVEVVDNKDYEEIDYYAAVSEDYYGKDVTYRAMAIGKNFSPFFAPKKLHLSCETTRGDTCKNCILFFVGGKYVKEIDESQSLDLIKCTQGEQKNKIKTLCGIHNCNQFKMEMDTQTIEEIFVAPMIDSERIDRQFIVRKCYSKGHNLQINKAYRFKGKTIPDAKTQEATQLFVSAEPEMSNLELFQLEPKDIDDLRIFNPRINSYAGIDERTYEISRDLSYNIPEVIIGRENLLFGYDLVFHSVLRFKLLDSVVAKGWTEMLAIGDTRTGKTKTAVKLCHHYRVGEYVTLESATLPGLVGGMSQVGRDVTFSWGVLPINDGRLVLLDEANGLDPAGISNLSSIRDNGVAERTVVGSTRKTTSRVRLIWISNPRSTKSISYYSTGVEAIRELMGRAEDISRLDFAIVVAKEDVGIEKINTASHKKPEHKYTSELCHKLIMWTWSRKEENIKFTKDAEDEILKSAIDMSNKYSDAIPLVQGSVQRIKIAKLAVALACRLFSTEDGINVIVHKEHVQFITYYLQQIYDSPYFGYLDFSNNKRDESKISDIDGIEKEIRLLDDSERFVNKMLATNTILYDDLVDFSGKSRDYVKDLKSKLVAGNCITRRKTFYIKTPEFIKLLKRMQLEVKRNG
ncbi:MAG TPA: hypothetical protein DDX29_12125 [Clostridiales bacterium]|nr:hypothetical protein [Clostridiales bacterium]